MRRRYYWCATCRMGQSESDEQAGLDVGKFSTGMRQLMALCGMSTSFGEAAVMLKRLAGVTCSKSAVRKVSLQEGGRVGREREGARRQWDWQGDGRLYVSADGVQVPLVEGWQEMKVGAFYDSRKTQHHAVAGFEGAEQFMPRLRREAIGMEAGKAKEIVLIGDGAKWIWKRGGQQLPMAVQILDFYHASEQIGACAYELYEEGSGQGKAWWKRWRDSLYERGAGWVSAALGGVEKRFKKKRKVAAVRKLREYLSRNASRADYPKLLEKGYDIGSGPVESTCKRLVTTRLKISGARWRKNNSLAIATLRACFFSDEWDTCFKAAA